MVQPAFYTDKDIAHRLRVSPSWVRGQRLKRSRGEDHVLDLEPRYIGSCVRYVVAEAEALIAAIEQGRR